MSDLDVHLSAVAAGDADAFGRWVAGAEARLRSSLARFATRVDVEAVLQETLLRCWQVAPKHRSDGLPDSLLRLAVRIARNVAIDEVRRQRLDARPDDEIETLLETAGSGHGEPGPDPLLRRTLAGCLALLKGRPAQAMRARLRGGHESDRALAESVGMRLNTFLQNVGRARKQLVDCLERNDIRLEEAWR